MDARRAEQDERRGAPAMLVGYARVSTFEQNLELQIDALDRAGCDKVFSEKLSGAKGERPRLAEALSHLRPGDTLVVWKLDRLGRSLKHLVETVAELEKRGVGFRSLQEQIDTTSPTGKLIFHVFCALAEFERDLTRQRTAAALAAARARGRKGGRPPKLDAKKQAQALSLYRDKTNSVTDICKTLKISRTTFYRYVAESRSGENGNKPVETNQ